MSTRTVLAVDLGAESGRLEAAHYDGRSIQLEGLHRFANTPVIARARMYWDFLLLWRNMQEGIQKGKEFKPASIGVDTWGVDFALLDSQGELVGNPVHYRDTRTEGMMEKVFAKVPQTDIFAQTGIQFLPINTLYQMMSLVESGSQQLKVAKTFLTAPDLLNYWLTGAKVCEFSNATTTQMLSARSGAWATDLLDKLGIPSHIFPEIVSPGTRLGEYDGIPVIAPACHDTGSAVAAVPTETDSYAYISSGTWSLVGLEVDEPVITDAAFKANVTNEGGVNGTYRLLKNVMGLWILRQCRNTWRGQGASHSYGELVEMAENAPSLVSIVNPNLPSFLTPGDHPQRIRELCRENGQPIPGSKGAIVRTVLESLALAYRDVLETLLEVSGRQVDVIHIVGGGSQNELLNQMTADATGIPVVSGPVEATIIGNALVQLIALGELQDIRQARQLVREMVGVSNRYQPEETADWQEAYEQYRKLTDPDNLPGNLHEPPRNR
jgi:rhamnulokinase